MDRWRTSIALRSHNDFHWTTKCNNHFTSCNIRRMRCASSVQSLNCVCVTMLSAIAFVAYMCLLMKCFQRVNTIHCSVLFVPYSIHWLIFLQSSIHAYTVSSTLYCMSAWGCMDSGLCILFSRLWKQWRRAIALRTFFVIAVQICYCFPFRKKKIKKWREKKN